jgi:hypothetical protein
VQFIVRPIIFSYLPQLALEYDRGVAFFLETRDSALLSLRLNIKTNITALFNIIHYFT